MNMDQQTGKIYDANELENMEQEIRDRCVLVDGADMTEFQKLHKQVSKFDAQSELGKRRVNYKNNLRNKPCPCKSGRKFKKCCMNK
jgi:uncharacterized protein YecA (UPF0149 family)